MVSNACNAIGDRDALQSATRLNGGGTDLCQGGGKRDALQGTAIQKRGSANARDTFGDGDVLQGIEPGEGMETNMRYATIIGNNGIRASTNQGFGCCFDQAIAAAAVHRVVFMHKKAFEIAAKTKRRSADARNASGDGDAPQSGAGIKGVVSDAR